MARTFAHGSDRALVRRRPGLGVGIRAAVGSEPTHSGSVPDPAARNADSRSLPEAEATGTVPAERNSYPASGAV